MEMYLDEVEVCKDVGLDQERGNVEESKFWS
jgi:hypothetical protein